MISTHEIRPHQHEMFTVIVRSIQESRIALIYGGRGTFKTSTSVWSLFHYLWYLSQYYTGIRIGVAAQSYDQLREVFVETWIEQAPFEGSRWRWGDNRKRIIMLGRSKYTGHQFDTELVLRHAGDAKEGAASQRAAAARKGANLSGYFLVQAESMSHIFADEIETQTRRMPVLASSLDWGPPHRIRIMDANPQGPDHWLHRRALDKGNRQYDGGQFIPFQIRTTPETSIYTEQQISSMRKSKSAEESARDLDAQWVGNVGTMFHVGSEHVTAEPPPQGGRWYLTFDYGYDPDPFVALLCYAAGPWIWVTGEVKLNRKLQDEQKDYVKSMIGQCGAPELSGVTGDPSGKYSEDDRPRYKGNLWWSDKLSVPYIGTSNKRAPGWSTLIRFLLQDEENRPRLTIHPRCEYLLSSLRGMRWAGTMHRKDDSDPSCDDHGADALRYLMMSDAVRNKK